MISKATRQVLQSKCRVLCEAFLLDCAYIAQDFGPRRHYLAGYGSLAAATARRLTLSDNLVLFWNGSISPEAMLAFRMDLSDTVRGIEQELSAKDAPSFRINEKD